MSREMREVYVCDDCGTHEDVAEWPQIGGDLCDACAIDHLARLCVSCGNSDEPVNRDKRCPGCAEISAWDAGEENQ